MDVYDKNSTRHAIKFKYHNQQKNLMLTGNQTTVKGNFHLKNLISLSNNDTNFLIPTTTIKTKKKKKNAGKTDLIFFFVRSLVC